MTDVAQAVIGANYGDEGKGHVTDFLAARCKTPATVVRYNSSAQAGHTVVTPDGQRHVFHHVGAGAFAGASTLLSRFFVAHPMLLTEELDTLGRLGIEPKLYADPRSRVAVPHDILLNQAIEQQRGTARHGSCGIGFNEAVERSLRPAYTIRVGDLLERALLRQRLLDIRDHWVPKRMRVLDLDPSTTDLADLLNSDAVIDRWLDDAEAFADRVSVLPPGTRPPGPVIFEGAQGLLLDQDGEDFPHVTRSKTGLTNVVRLAQEMEIDALDVTYVTRAYLTRHGAGPLANELSVVPDTIADETNAPNAFQGALRVAWLDLDRLAAAIHRDLQIRAAGIDVQPSLAVTCLDQTGDRFRWFENSSLREGDEQDFLVSVERKTLPSVNLRSYGPGREAIVN